jgi:hypothetical protein
MALDPNQPFDPKSSLSQADQNNGNRLNTVQGPNAAIQNPGWKDPGHSWDQPKPLRPSSVSNSNTVQDSHIGESIGVGQGPDYSRVNITPTNNPQGGANPLQAGQGHYQEIIGQDGVNHGYVMAYRPGSFANNPMSTPAASPSPQATNPPSAPTGTSIGNIAHAAMNVAGDHPYATGIGLAATGAGLAAGARAAYPLVARGLSNIASGASRVPGLVSEAPGALRAGLGRFGGSALGKIAAPAALIGMGVEGADLLAHPEKVGQYQDKVSEEPWYQRSLEGLSQPVTSISSAIRGAGQAIGAQADAINSTAKANEMEKAVQEKEARLQAARLLRHK